MDKKTVFIKTAKGEQEFSNLSGDLRRAMSLIDNKSTVDEMSRRAPPSLRDDLYEVLGELVAGDYIRDKNRPAEAKIVAPKITAPKITAPKMFVPKQSTPSKSEELDFTSLASKPAFNPATAARTMGKADEAELARAELEIAMAQSGMKPIAEDEASKEAKLRAKVAAAERARSELEAGIDAAKARASADAATKAEAKARQEADIAARARAAAESKALQEAANREQAEAKAKLEAAARMRAEQEAAREAAKAKAAMEAAAKSKADADARIRAEIEMAARARQVAEAKVKQEAEAARLKAEQEAARVKAELEAAAKAKAEAEAARIRAEQEAARIKAELEAAKARAEAEEKARREAEEKARREAEEKARREAEEKARREAEEKARREAEEKARREAEEKARREAEERAIREAEAVRLRAEQEAQAARVKAEQEAQAALLMAEQEAAANAKVEALALKEAEAAAQVRARQEPPATAQEPLLRVDSLKPAASKGAGTSSFKIDLDSFLEEEPEPRAKPVLSSVDRAAEAEAEADTKARQEAVQRAVAEAKSLAEKGSKPDMAAEMARLKAEADAARQKAEEEERRKQEERALAEEQANAWAEAEQRAQAQARIEAEQAAQQAALSQAKAANKSAPRKRRAPLPLGKISFGLLVLALIAVVVLPYIYPLQEYIAPLEKRLSAQLKQPIRIGGMSAASIPPKLQLQNVTIGIEQEMKISDVVLSINPLSLFSETKVISDALLDNVSIKGEHLERLAPGLMLAGADSRFPVRHLTLQRVKITSEEVALPSLNGVAELDAQGAFSRIALHSEDEKYNIDMQPDQGRWQLGVSLKETSLPLLPDIVFSDLSAKGILGDGEVNFTEMDAHIFKGILLGSAKLNWRKGWQLQGRLEAKSFELDKMFPQYGIKGEMYGEGSFALSGDKLSQIGGTRRLEATFSVKNGEIGAIDMVETARLLSRENLVGGRTRFDDLIGTVRVENGASDFRQLKIVSSMLSASGSFDVSPTGQLSGNLNAEIKMRAGNNQMTLFGTLAEPKLRAGR